MKVISLTISAIFSSLIAESLNAQPLVSVDAVLVGDAGNASDTTGYGSVGYDYRMGKYEVTIGQYTSFLNSVASVTSDSYIINLWNASMTSDLNIAGISRSGSGTLASPYSYSVIGSGNRPIAYVSWFDGARFANWMNNGATNGASTETGAYTLNGATSGLNFTKNAGATWWLPTENEWYKAAYYKGGGTNAGYWSYATRSDIAPGNSVGNAANQANYKAGSFAVTQSSGYTASQNYLTDVGAFSNSASGYETFDQSGNVNEWIDGDIAGLYRVHRGGNWFDSTNVVRSSYRGGYGPETERYEIGFRVATVPEPSTYALLAVSGLVFIVWRLRRKKNLLSKSSVYP
jgi:sulfatase modifying factor 1